MSTKISDLQKLPRPELAALAMHALGINLKSVYSEPTYYRLSNSLKKYGYDVTRQIDQKTITTKSLEIASNKYL